MRGQMCSWSSSPRSDYQLEIPKPDSRRPVVSVWTTEARSFLAYETHLDERTQDVDHNNHPRIIPSC